jgi:hypothetical protein
MSKEEVKAENKEEPFPVHKTVNVVNGKTISKGNDWWSAVLLVESYGGRKNIAVYLWRKRPDGTWRRMQKLTIATKKQWEELKKSVDEKFASLCINP